MFKHEFECINKCLKKIIDVKIKQPLEIYSSLNSLGKYILNKNKKKNI